VLAAADESNSHADCSERSNGAATQPYT
jgi:hypothetical protein